MPSISPRTPSPPSVLAGPPGLCFSYLAGVLLSGWGIAVPWLYVQTMAQPDADRGEAADAS